MPEPVATITVEVVYADAQQQLVRRIDIAAGASVADAIRASAILDALPGFEPARLGIFGRIVQATHALRDGDRIELYRPLKIDPKQARRLRVAKSKKL